MELQAMVSRLEPRSESLMLTSSGGAKGSIHVMNCLILGSQECMMLI